MVPRRSPARWRTAAVVVAVVAALVATVVPGPAGAQEATVIDDPRLDPSLAGVVVAGDGYQATLGAYRAAQGREADARAHLDDVAGRERSTADLRQQLTDELAATTAERDGAAAEAETVRRTLRAIAVESYMSGRDPETADAVVDGPRSATDDLRLQNLTETVSRDHQSRLRDALATVERTTATIDDDTARLADADATAAALVDERSATEAALEAAVEEVAATRQALADWRLTGTVSGSDLPLIALDAYVKAAGRLAFERPECGLRWWGLAGIGKVESGHGTYLGSRLAADGTTTRPIIGVPLDGSGGNALVGDSDGGQLDGDGELDRAVGPMQFLPSSWRTLGRDGNGDGRADPHNIYDAALAAAGLLCRAGGTGLDADAGLHRAALGYNASGAYADQVVATARRYAASEAELIPPPPTTTTTSVAPSEPDAGAGAAPAADAPPSTGPPPG